MTERTPAAGRPRVRRPGLGPRLVLKFPPEEPLTDPLFTALAGENDALRLERNAQGDLELMAPVGGDGSRRNFLLSVRLGRWTEGAGAGLGLAFDSSAGFTLPDGSILSPDASWVASERWDALTPDRRQGFAHVCPDFVAELRPETDRRPDLRRKMQTYMNNGARLGWLIDPAAGGAAVYHAGRPPEVLKGPAALSGEDVLPGFSPDLSGILTP